MGTTLVGGGVAAGKPRRMLTVWWAHWPVVAAGAAGQYGRHDPVIVLRANRVVAASPAALASGVVVGQRRRVAQQRCPEATLVEHDPDRDARAFEPVVRAVGEFTPRLELVEPGWLCVESRGPSRYFGGDEDLAARVVDTVAATVGATNTMEDTGGLGVAIADGRFASAVAARRGAPTCIVPPGGSAEFLAPLPVAWLGDTGEVDAELVGLLARLGLATLGAVAALERIDVEARFGPPGAHAHRLASGDDERPAHALDPPVERAVERTFDDPVLQLGPLVFVGKQLADELVANLAAAGLSCVRLVAAAETEHGERSERTWYRGNGLSAAAIVERIRWQLDGWVAQPGGLTAGVVLLRLEPVELRPVGGEQLRLWGGLSAADQRAVRTIARLAGMVGEPAVQVPAWQGGRLPGDRYQWVPATTTDLTDPDDTAGRLRPKLAGEQPWPGSLPAPSPSLLGAPGEDAPREAVVLDAAGHRVAVSGRGAVSAPPASLAVEGRAPQPIIGWAGPWPVDECWWDSLRHRRLARFQLVTADGAAHLAVVEQQHWWLFASYA